MTRFLQHLREQNVKRCEAPRSEGGYGHPLDAWTPLEWAGAAAGEMGEACNLVKKVRRGDDVPLSRVADEIGDVVVYLDLLCACMGIDLEKAVVDKFNATSEKYDCDIRLQEE